MKNLYLPRRSIAEAILGLASMLTAAMLGGSGCKTLGPQPIEAPQPSTEGSEGSAKLLASVTLADGSRVEFVGIEGQILVTAEFDRSRPSPIAPMSKGMSLVALYEELSGQEAPSALVDAERHALASQPSSTLPPRVEVVEPAAERATGPSISMSAASFQANYCEDADFCWTNRVSVGSLVCSSGPFGIHLVYLDCVRGVVNFDVAKQNASGSWQVFYSRDHRANSKILQYGWTNLLPESRRLRFTPREDGKYHVAVL